MDTTLLFLPAMDDSHCLDYRITGCFSQLICDYLDQKTSLQNYYNRFPKLENFKAQINERSAFPEATRQVLVESLCRQYDQLQKSEVEDQAVFDNLQKLGSKNTFTVVTGHQLNLFTGPLYFIYKIISTINLTERLAAQYPEYNFVPVYWMATEDHDFAEINHINLYGGKLRWEREAAGPVGRFSTEGLDVVIAELEEHLGPGTHAREFIDLLRKSYLSHPTLAQASRYLVHQLFARFGLVIADGDDTELKKLAIPSFRKELFEQLSHEKVTATSKKLEQEYFEQVTAREINLFYIQDGLRERIVKTGKEWQVLGTELRFNADELEQELQNHPERFSPNVILRPLYQELILPNLAYVGGGGELAYWLQLRDMFSSFEVPFPMLVLRNSVLWINSKQQRKMKDLGLSIKDLFKPLHRIKEEYVKGNAPVDADLNPYEKKLQQIFDELEEVAHLTDKSMLGAVNAQRQKQLNGLENLKKKLIKAEKRRQSTSVERIENLYFSLFPKGSLQERHDNLSAYYAEYGYQWIQDIKDELDPLDFRFSVLTA